MCESGTANTHVSFVYSEWVSNNQLDSLSQWQVPHLASFISTSPVPLFVLAVCECAAFLFPSRLLLSCLCLLTCPLLAVPCATAAALSSLALFRAAVACLARSFFFLSASASPTPPLPPPASPSLALAVMTEVSWRWSLADCREVTTVDSFTSPKRAWRSRAGSSDKDSSGVDDAGEGEEEEVEED